MPAQVTTLLRRLAASIREFTIAQRTVAIIGVAVLVLGIAALALWMSKPAYTPLFSGLAAVDANSIVDQLRTDGVQYQLTDGGGTILVPEANVYDERLKAAAAGLPTSNTGGYALLDKMGVTASEFQQSVTYKRALEGELANTIQAMKGVKTASVRLAIPKDTVFVSQKTDPTASVFIQTQNGVTLSDGQVQAIVHLTSASIDGMKAEDVAVIDSQGIVLSAVGTGVTGGADKQSSDYEARVGNSVQAMLDKVVGPGNATVVVAADLSQDSGQRVEETFTSPTNAPTLNESSKTESSSGGAQSSTGILGPDNIAVPTGTTGTTGGSFIGAEVTKNNAINKVTQSTTIPAGSLKRQTVSVAINSAVAGSLNMANIKSLVATAAGIDTTRGDQVTVASVAFNQAGAADAAKAIAAAESAAAADRTAAVLRTAIVVLGIIAPIAIAIAIFLRRARRRKLELEELQEMGELAELRAMMTDQTVPIALAAPAGPAPLTYTQLPSEPGDADRKRADIDALAAADPQRAAEFLRGLMDDRQPV
jgi:flagellar M-ring protein FliF